MYRCHFQLKQSLFLKIIQAICELYILYTKEKLCWNLGLPSTQKFTFILCILAYGVSEDTIDQYCKLDTSIAIKTIKQFVVII